MKLSVLRRSAAVLVVAFALVLTGVFAASAQAAPVSRTAATKAASGARIVAVAKRYVGKARYREGGTGPRRGFDCSGYTAYAYKTAKVATLPHNAESQRHAKHMRRISAHTARPGDLVFYLSGGRAYHVAIYAGHHKQYAAATARSGIRYQKIWSSHVEYRTDWH